jgi:hypothetical protein
VATAVTTPHYHESLKSGLRLLIARVSLEHRHSGLIRTSRRIPSRWDRNSDRRGRRSADKVKERYTFVIITELEPITIRASVAPLATPCAGLLFVFEFRGDLTGGPVVTCKLPLSECPPLVAFRLSLLCVAPTILRSHMQRNASSAQVRVAGRNDGSPLPLRLLDPGRGRGRRGAGGQGRKSR